MDRNARSHQRQTRGGVQSRARRAQAVDYFNILTSPGLLDITEAHLPEHRKRSVKDTPRTGIDYAEASLSGLPRFQGNKAS